MDQVVISSQLLNSIANYLGGRPFVEVAGLIQSIQQEVAKQNQMAASQEPANVAEMD